VTVNSKEENSYDFCPNYVQEFGVCLQHEITNTFLGEKRTRFAPNTLAHSSHGRYKIYQSYYSYTVCAFACSKYRASTWPRYIICGQFDQIGSIRIDSTRTNRSVCRKKHRFLFSDALKQVHLESIEWFNHSILPESTSLTRRYWKVIRIWK
jgi:hypothetical protein